MGIGADDWQCSDTLPVAIVIGNAGPYVSITRTSLFLVILVSRG